MLAFSNDYYGMIFRATQSVELFCAYIQTVPTDDKSKDNLIAVRAADGYEKGDKVLRPERIKIFKYEAPATKPTENN